MPRRFIPVCEVALEGRELNYVTRAVKSGWISSSGEYVNAFERRFARFCGQRHAVGVCNGTMALHLALVALGVGRGDEVIIPDFTMIASAFAVCYTGATPVFVDAEPDTWNMDADRIEEKIGPKTKAIMPVSIFAHPCDMDKIRRLARRHRLSVVEDAAESHGSRYRGRKTGSLADITTFSFYANKNLTTGEGGMVVTDDRRLYERAIYFRNMCFSLDGVRDYVHRDIGFNYRMTNLTAAVGLAQVEKADEYIRRRIQNGEWYRRYLSEIPGIIFQQKRPDVVQATWMNGLVVDSGVFGRTRDELAAYLKKKGIDTRLFFTGMHRQPSLLNYGCDGSGRYPVSNRLTKHGLYLPSSVLLREKDIRSICRTIAAFRRLN